jgi:dethiobiotin synthetase
VSAFFVTATGTDIGKTFVTSCLIRHLRAAGQSVDALKPVLSGYDPATAETSDAGALLQALGRPVNETEIARITPWRFSAPLAPDLAAAREGKVLDVEAVIAHSRDAIAKASGTLLIEGVGGVMVPLDPTRSVLDWMMELNIPLVLVTGSYLGTISHTLTALAALRHADLAVRAVVVSETAGSTVPLADTVETLTRFGHGAKVVAVPRFANTSDAHAHPAFAELAALLHD